MAAGAEQEKTAQNKTPETPAAPAAPAAAPAASGTNAAAKETLSQKNAKAAAKNYLKVTAFSHDGLVEQLEFEQFSAEDAAYGADQCGADWNEQAVKSAKQYLNTTAFSYQGLVEQLEFSKFTHEQAVYGADGGYRLGRRTGGD